ncbi:MAG TPA: tRNA-uridine aminocarboxypropyltransferase [Polyangiaceae bacterium]|jgi:DTW domain-containing protein YfiP
MPATRNAAGASLAGGRAVCRRCRRPESVCYCAAVKPIATQTRVVILQHPRERDVPINTARIAALCLPNSEMHVGVTFSDGSLRAELSRDAARPPILLFPSAESRDLEADPPVGPVTLVVLDGTWWQAEKIYKSNRALRQLPHYSLNPGRASRYRIRREPALHCLSTIEALACALAVLEGGDSDVQGLLAPFEQMVERQLEFIRSGSRPRHRVSNRYAEQPVLPILKTRAQDVLLGYGEANAWPYGTAGAPEPEVVHWLATRVATGERFEAYIAPTGAFAPSLFRHTDLVPERVRNGETVAAFCERWERFLRPNDLLAGWGFYAARLLRTRGVPVPPLLDLREAAIRSVGRCVGELDDYVSLLNLERDPAWAEGRTGRRMASIEALARHLARASRRRRVRAECARSG